MGLLVTRAAGFGWLIDEAQALGGRYSIACASDHDGCRRPKAWAFRHAAGSQVIDPARIRQSRQLKIDGGDEALYLFGTLVENADKADIARRFPCLPAALASTLTALAPRGARHRKKVREWAAPRLGTWRAASHGREIRIAAAALWAADHAPDSELAQAGS